MGVFFSVKFRVLSISGIENHIWLELFKIMNEKICFQLKSLKNRTVIGSKSL